MPNPNPVPKPLKRVACCYIFTNNDEVLLLKHPKFGVWLPPGGHVEEGETYWQALRRELQEEIGFDIGDGVCKVIDHRATRYRQPFFVQIDDHGDHDCESMFYAHRVYQKFDVVSPENLEYKWFSIHEAAQMTTLLFENTRQHLLEIMEKFTSNF